MRIADPRPDVCSVCRNTQQTDTRFFDLEANWDGRPLTREDGSVIYPGDGRPMGSEYIMLCEPCCRELLELVDFKPELHNRQLGEIRKLEQERNYWRDTARRERQASQKHLEANGLMEGVRTRKAVR